MEKFFREVKNLAEFKYYALQWIMLKRAAELCCLIR